MEPCFGEFITQEYGVLKQILSNLQRCDLRNAKLVCRDWHNAVNALIDRNPKVFLCNDNDNDNGLFAVPQAILPDLILHPAIKYMDFEKPKICENCDCWFLICPCKLSSPDSVYVTFTLNWFSLQDWVEGSFWNMSSVLLLSSSEHVKISTFYLESASDMMSQPVTDEGVVTRCIGGEEPIKAILIISSLNPETSTDDWFNSLLCHIAARQGLTFAIGGGVAAGLCYKKGVTPNDGQLKKRGAVIITFRGDNVQAQSDVFSPNESETTWSNFKQRTGEVPVGGTQIAFIAQNVAIHPTAEDGKTQYKHFKKHFPNAVPCTFRSLQEFGIRNSITDPEEIEDRNRARYFSSWETASLLVLTFKKV